MAAVGDNATSWFWHALMPAVLFGVCATVLATTNLDIEITRAWAYDAAAHRFLGAGPGEWWAKNLIHSWGGFGVRLLGGVIVLGFLLSYLSARLRTWRRPAAYLLLAGGLALGSVGLLRAISNVDCPWSLDLFDGTRPYVHLLGDRPDSLPHARCFPGGHSSSGFALFAFYFLFAERRRAIALACLTGAVVVGGIFSIGQEARGAHFLSHDLWSAAFAWFSCLGVYAFGFRRHVWSAPSERTLEFPEHTQIGHKARPIVQLLPDARRAVRLLDQ